MGSGKFNHWRGDESMLINNFGFHLIIHRSWSKVIESTDTTGVVRTVTIYDLISYMEDVEAAKLVQNRRGRCKVSAEAAKLVQKRRRRRRWEKHDIILLMLEEASNYWCSSHGHHIRFEVVYGRWRMREEWHQLVDVGGNWRLLTGKPTDSWVTKRQWCDQ